VNSVHQQISYSEFGPKWQVLYGAIITGICNVLHYTLFRISLPTFALSTEPLERSDLLGESRRRGTAAVDHWRPITAVHLTLFRGGRTLPAVQLKARKLTSLFCIEYSIHDPGLFFLLFFFIHTSWLHEFLLQKLVPNYFR